MAENFFLISTKSGLMLGSSCQHSFIRSTICEVLRSGLNPDGKVGRNGGVSPLRTRPMRSIGRIQYFVVTSVLKQYFWKYLTERFEFICKSLITSVWYVFHLLLHKMTNIDALFDGTPDLYYRVKWYIFSYRFYIPKSKYLAKRWVT